MSQREEAQRRQPRLAGLAKNSECPSPNRSAWRDGAVVDCGADFASRRVCAPVVVDRKPFTRPDHGGVCAWPPLHDVLGGFVDRHDCAAVLVMAGDDAADGEAHGVSPSVMVWGGSFAGRRCDCNGLTSRRIPAASYALSVPRPLGSCIVHHSKIGRLCLSRVELGHCGDVRCTTALPPKADVHPRSCYVAFVPKPVLSRCSK